MPASESNVCRAVSWSVNPCGVLGAGVGVEGRKGLRVGLAGLGVLGTAG
jgi:hypothetical protein